MVAVLAHGEGAFRLVNAAGRDVGWIRPRVIGFGAFATADRARAASLAGARVLASCLKREFGVSHLELSDRPRARTVRAGADEWVVDGPVRVARLVPVESGRGSGHEFAIEFVLPSYATDAVAISAAQVVYRALSAYLTDTLDLRVAATADGMAG